MNRDVVMRVPFKPIVQTPVQYQYQHQYEYVLQEKNLILPYVFININPHKSSSRTHEERKKDMFSLVLVGAGVTAVICDTPSNNKSYINKDFTNTSTAY